MEKSNNKVTPLASATQVLPGGYINVSVYTNELLFILPEFSELTGYTSSELLAQKSKWSKAIFHPLDLEAFKNDMNMGLIEGNRAYSETRIMCKDGSTIWVDVYAGLLENEQWGKYVHMKFIDNTKRRRVLVSAESTRREMDALIKNIPGGVARVIVDKDFRILFASEGFYRLTGYTKEEFHGVPILDRGAYVIHADDIDRIGQEIASQIANNEQMFVEYRIRKKNGHTAWIEAHGTLLTSQNGVMQAQVIFTETTDAKRSARRLLRLTNSVPGGVAHISLVEENVVVDYASDGFYRIIGYTQDEFTELGLGLNCAPLFSPADWQVLREQIKSFFKGKKPNGEIECKVRGRDGDIKWVNIKGSRRDDEKQRLTIECVITDVSVMHKSLDQLRQSEERYRFLSEQMTEIIVEWDISSGDMYHTSAFERRFGYKLPTRGTQMYLLNSDLIFKDDLHLMINIMNSIKSGSKYAEAEYRLKDATGAYQWCGIRLTNVFDEDGKPFKAVGIILDMANMKKTTAQLEEKMQLDPLTNVYNTIATKDHIRNSLRRRKPEHASAMFAVDVDNFKSVNDSYGHLMGDEVLLQMTQRLGALIRQGDIFGRVGGDEFVIFIPNDMSRAGAQQKANSFIQAMQEPISLNGVECSTHISVGISLCPGSGDTYEELYDKADRALYEAKEKGRNRYAIYDE